MTSQPHIGMTVWQFDPNRRVYPRDDNGRAFGGPIWREHWVRLCVIGETSKSWLVGPDWMASQLDRAEKVAKKAWPGNLLTSEAEIERAAFVEQRYRLAERVQKCLDYDTLKTIEAALDAI